MNTKPTHSTPTLRCDWLKILVCIQPHCPGVELLFLGRTMKSSSSQSLELSRITTSSPQCAAPLPRDQEQTLPYISITWLCLDCGRVHVYTISEAENYQTFTRAQYAEYVSVEE